MQLLHDFSTYIYSCCCVPPRSLALFGFRDILVSSSNVHVAMWTIQAHSLTIPAWIRSLHHRIYFPSLVSTFWKLVFSTTSVAVWIFGTALTTKSFCDRMYCRRFCSWILFFRISLLPMFTFVASGTLLNLD